MAFEIKLYLLELRHGKFYVGQASDPAFRFQEHLAGTGAKWTRLHKPIRVRKIHSVNVESPAEAMMYENWTTLQAMERFGWETVRGGDFLVVEDYLLKQRIAHIYDFDINKIIYYTETCKRYLFGNSQHWLIYVLELANGRFYIGSCKQLGKSLGANFSGKGILWTRDNPVIRVSEIITIMPGMDSYVIEKEKLVRSYMNRYGWDNVAGGQRPPKGDFYANKSSKK